MQCIPRCNVIFFCLDLCFPILSVSLGQQAIKLMHRNFGSKWETYNVLLGNTVYLVQKTRVLQLLVAVSFENTCLCPFSFFFFFV